MSSEVATFLLIALAIVIIVAATVLSILWTRRRSQTILQRWAERNGLQLLESELRWFRRGPFFLSGRGQVVYYVSAMDGQGMIHRGWVRCGGFWLGLLRDEAEVRWDPQSEGADVRA